MLYAKNKILCESTWGYIKMCFFFKLLEQKNVTLKQDVKYNNLKVLNQGSPQCIMEVLLLQLPSQALGKAAVVCLSACSPHWRDPDAIPGSWLCQSLLTCSF